MKTATAAPLTPTRKKMDSATANRLRYEKGMTIKAIAEKCGVCPATVRRYLSPVDKANGVDEAPIIEVPAESGKPKTSVAIHRKQLVQSKIELKGKTAVFEIDHDAHTLFVRGASFEMILAHDEVAPFIWELVEAYESVQQRKGTEPVRMDGAVGEATS